MMGVVVVVAPSSLGLILARMVVVVVALVPATRRRLRVRHSTGTASSGGSDGCRISAGLWLPRNARRPRGGGHVGSRLSVVLRGIRGRDLHAGDRIVEIVRARDGLQLGRIHDGRLIGDRHHVWLPVRHRRRSHGGRLRAHHRRLGVLVATTIVLR